MKDRAKTAIFTVYDEFEPFEDCWGEKALLQAIVLNALADLAREGIVQRQAKDYILNDDEDDLFSFRSICEYLHVDPERVRSKILEDY